MKKWIKAAITYILILALTVSMVAPQSLVVQAAQSDDDYHSQIGYPVADTDGLILEFTSENALEEFYIDNGGERIGGLMLLVDGSYQEAVYYEKLPGIESVTYNYTVDAAGLADAYGDGRDVSKDDPYLESENMGIWEALGQIADTVVDFSLYTVRVGVLDTGIDATHEDLTDRVADGYDALEDAQDRFIAADINSDQSIEMHGTMVAGLIAAEALNATGIAGTAGCFAVELVPIRVLDENGKGKIADIVRGIYWAIENDVDILNMSFGARLEYYPSALARAIEDARMQHILPIAAAGNEYGMTWEGYYPACLEGCYPVMSGSVGMGSDYTSDFSNTFPEGAVPGRDYTSISGYEIMTTGMGNSYREFTGTSASSALISGYAAAMLSVLGGRTNATAIDTVIDVFTFAHTTNTNLIPYSIVLSEMGAAVSQYITEERINMANILIQGSVECDIPLAGEEEITTVLSFGEGFVGDVSLALYDEEENLIYISEPVVNDGTNAKEYTFRLDATSYEDGNAKIVIYYRTAEEVSAHSPVTSSRHMAQKDVIIRNSLILSDAIIRLYDTSGAEFTGTVFVTDPENGALVKILDADENSMLMVSRELFSDGQLSFTYLGGGMYYTKTTGFQAEIRLGGEESQLTRLEFFGQNKILAGADVYAVSPGGYVKVGKTDEAGNITIHMSDGTLKLIVMDNTEHYLLSVSATQDGNLSSISYGAEIDSAALVPISAISGLAGEDKYALVVSHDPFENATKGVSTDLFSKDVTGIYLGGSPLYMMAAVYDVFYLEAYPDVSSAYRYFYTAHLLGQIDPASVTEIAFDPGAIYADVSLESGTVIYGKKTGYEYKAIDNKGNPVIGGHYLEYATLGEAIDCDTWYGSQMLFLKDAEENDHSYLIDISQNTIYTTTEYGMALPAQNGDYTFTADCYIETYYLDGYIGFLEYRNYPKSAALHVEMGATLQIDLEAAPGVSYVYCDSRTIQVINGGVLQNAYVLSQTDQTYIVDASEFDNGTKIFLWVNANFEENTALGTANYCYPVVVEYDAEEPIVTAKMPQEDYGLLDVRMGNDTVYDMNLRLACEDVFVNVRGGYEAAYPAGEYDIFFRMEAGDGKAVLGYETVTICADEKTELSIDVSEYKTLTLDKSEMTTVMVTPVVDGAVIEWSDPYFGMLYNTENTLLLAPEIDSVHATYYPMDYEFIGGIAWIVELTAGSRQNYLDGENVSIVYFEAAPEKAEFAAQEEVVINLETKVTGDYRLISLAKALPSDGGKGVAQEEVLPTLRYRLTGGSWEEKELSDFRGINLGVLESGRYEAVLALEDGDVSGGIQDSTFAFVVADGVSVPEHVVLLSAPATAKEEVKLTINGTPSAVVTLRYTSPSGQKKTFEGIVIPENGVYRINVPMTEEGTYSFSATSALEGAEEIEAEALQVENTFAVPGQIAGFSVTSQADGSLKLKWNEPTDALKIYVYRDGTVLGYLPGNITEYTDSHTYLNSNRTYTYSLIPENEAGTRGEAVYAQGKPSTVVDSQAPSAPVTLTAEADGMSIQLNWTRSNDNVGVVGYRVYRDGVLIKDTVKRSYTDEGLKKATKYHYTVTAYDSAGNESVASLIASATTAENYSIDGFSVDLGTNRLGNITDDYMGILVSAGAVDRVAVEILYTTKEGEQEVYELELGKSGAFWTGSWSFNRVYQIDQVTAYAYEGQELAASKEADGFPRSVASSVGVELTVLNALYAQNALEHVQIQLQDKERHLSYTKKVSKQQETEYYCFEDLSDGIYELTVEYALDEKHHILYHKDQISVGNGVETVLSPIVLDNFVRIYQDYPFMLYGSTVYDHIDEEKYLVHNEDSVIFTKSTDTSLSLISPWEKVPLCINGNFYVLPKIYQITLVEGIAEYEIDALAGCEQLQGIPYTFQFLGPDGVDLKDLSMHFNWGAGTVVTALDENGACTITVPEAISTIFIYTKEAFLEDTAGNSHTVLEQRVEVSLVNGQDPAAIQLPIKSREKIKLQFTSQADLADLKVRITGGEEVVKLSLASDGYAEIYTSFFVGNDLTAYIEGGFIGDYYIPGQYQRFEYDEQTDIYHTNVEVEQKVDLPYFLKFEDAVGYSVAGMEVQLVTRHMSQKFILDETGIIEGELLSSDATEDIYVYVQGKNELRQWSGQRFLVTPGRELQVITAYSKIMLSAEGVADAYQYVLFYGQGEQMQQNKLTWNGSKIEIGSNDWVKAQGNAKLLAIPKGAYGNELYISKYSTEEQFNIWKACSQVQIFELNQSNLDQIITVEDPEYYTITAVKDMIGEPITGRNVYLYVGDELISRTKLDAGIGIPKLGDGQRLVMSMKHQRETKEEIQEALVQYEGTYYLEYVISDVTPHELEAIFGYQSVFLIEIKDTQGLFHKGEAYLAIFNAETKQLERTTTYFSKEGQTWLRIDDCSQYEIFAGWVIDGDATLCGMYSFWDELEGNVASCNIIPTVPSNGTISLCVPYEPIYRLSRINRDLDTSIKSVTEISEGVYQVRLKQTSASFYDSVISLPEGAYEIQKDGMAHAGEGQILLPVNSRGVNITFLIRGEDLERDNLIKCYIETPHGKSLQFAREIEREVFRYGIRRVASSNEVKFTWTDTEDRGKRTSGEYVGYPISVFNLSPTYGTYFGYESYSMGQGKYLYVDESSPNSDYYDPDYDIYDYKGVAFTEDRGIYYVNEGRWVTFTSETDDFAIALNVDDLPLVLDADPPFTMVQLSVNGSIGFYYMLPNGQYMPVGYRMPTTGKDVKCTFSEHYDDELGCYWISSEFLADYGWYDPSTGYGAIYVPMKEPEEYPHVYDIDLRFKYFLGDGEEKIITKEDSISVYYNAPVLEKWKYDHYGRDGVTSSSMQYATITSREDREAYLNSKDNTVLDWNGTDIFTFYAWFDYPEEVAKVYAVADVPDHCKNQYIELHYDAELQCFTGTGVLGDALNPPKNFNIHYELAAEQSYQGMPTIQVMDFLKSAVNKELQMEENTGLPEGWSYEETAPLNGWTLQETYEKWEAFGSLLDALVEGERELTEEDLIPILGQDLLLYLPLYNIYDEQGQLVMSVQNYYNLTGERITSDYSYDVALMDGSELYATVTQGMSVNEEEGTIQFVTGSDNLSLILPDAGVEQVDSAGIGAVLGMLKPKATQVGSALVASKTGQAVINQGGKLIGYGKQLAANENFMAGADCVSTAFLTRDMISAGGDLDSIRNIYNGSASMDWVYDLTPEQFQDYMDYKSVKSKATIAGTLFGAISGSVLSIGLTLGMDVIYGIADIDAKYQQMAKLNREMLKQQQEMLEYMRNQGAQGDLQYHIDPSGYIFEGMESNLLEGVTATVYYLDVETDTWIPWDSEAYGEGPNPNISDGQGRYGWDVLIGKWKVVFEKEGYYTVESVELDVPPAHLDVNMSMVSLYPAMFEQALPAAAGEYIEFSFDRPVLVEDVINKTAIFYGGETVDGEIVAVNEALTTFGNKQKQGANDVLAGQRVATVFRFVPDEALEIGSSVVLRGEAGILTYNGLECAGFETDYLVIPEEVADPITALFYDSNQPAIHVGDQLNLRIGLEVTGTEGEILYHSLTPGIASVDDNGLLTALTGGMAYVSISSGEAETVAAVMINQEPHLHQFNVEHPLMGALASEATCNQKATYYYYCDCGEMGTATYEYGNFDTQNHSGSCSWNMDETTHRYGYDCCDVVVIETENHEWQEGACEECGYVCAHEGGTATCKEKAVCEYCGSTYGEKDPDNHADVAQWNRTENSHSKVYLCCDAVLVEESAHDLAEGICRDCGYGCPHTGGIATCKELAVCTNCGTQYGNKDPGNHTGTAGWSCTESMHMKAYDCCGVVLVTEELHEWLNGICTECGYQCIHSGGIATCKEKAACEHCHIPYGEKNPERHAGNAIWQSDDTYHTQIYECCGVVVTEKSEHRMSDGVCMDCGEGCSHNGGVASCIDQAVCVDCGKAYGETEAANHSGAEEWIVTHSSHSKKFVCCGLITVQEESHEWIGGTCAECGYVCAHAGGSATCTEAAKCTICNSTYGKKDPNRHTQEAEWIIDQEWHQKHYDCCGEVVIEKSSHELEDGICYQCGYGCEHQGGIATCTAKAVCEKCGVEYGQKDPDNHAGAEEWAESVLTHRKGYTCCGEITIQETGHKWKGGSCKECGYICKHHETISGHDCAFCGMHLNDCIDTDENGECDICHKILMENRSGALGIVYALICVGSISMMGVLYLYLRRFRKIKK